MATVKADGLRIRYGPRIRGKGEPSHLLDIPDHERAIRVDGSSDALGLTNYLRRRDDAVDIAVAVGGFRGNEISREQKLHGRGRREMSGHVRGDA